MNKEILTGAIIATLLAPAAFADEDKYGMETAVAAGLTLTEGNSETRQMHGSITSSGRKQGLGSLRLGLEGTYGESKTRETRETTTEYIRAYASSRETLGEKTFAYVDATVLYDDIAAIDYRATIGPGLGMYLLQRDNLSFSVESGASYLTEKQAGISDNYLAWRAAERVEWEIGETGRLWHSAEILPEADDLENYLLNVELGIRADLNSRMHVRLVLQDRYDNRPAKGQKHNDLSLIASLGMDL